MEERMRALMAHSDAQVSHLTETGTQRLEGKIQAAMTSVATTARENTRAVVKEMRKDVQAQLEQTRTDA